MIKSAMSWMLNIICQDDCLISMHCRSQRDKFQAYMPSISIKPWNRRFKTILVHCHNQIFNLQDKFKISFCYSLDRWIDREPFQLPIGCRLHPIRMSVRCRGELTKTHRCDCSRNKTKEDLDRGCQRSIVSLNAIACILLETIVFARDGWNECDHHCHAFVRSRPEFGSIVTYGFDDSRTRTVANR